MNPVALASVQLQTADSLSAPAGPPFLHPQDLELLQRLLALHLGAQHPVWIVGSRATGRRLKPHSDLDLLIEGPALSLDRRADLVEALSESSLPMRVDVLEAARLDERFRRGLVEAGAVVVGAAPVGLTS